MKTKVFVDGQEGTTGLQINDRLEKRDDIEILKIDPELRKDLSERKKYINNADIVFLCLPDAASRESVSLIENDHVKIIDASTAYRTNDQWVYGLPELGSEYREGIKNAKRVSNPGCHATGFNILMYPLVKLGIISRDYWATCYSITGYSGGGNKMIAQYQDPQNVEKLSSPNIYGLNFNHKHLPEMKKVSGLINPPLFTPMVCNYYKGMTVAVPLIANSLNKKINAEELHEYISDYYKDQVFVRVKPFDINKSLDNGFLNATDLNGTNNLEIFVFGNEDHILLASRFDNLGKGASGAAIQNMNLMIGAEENKGL